DHERRLSIRGAASVVISSRSLRFPPRHRHSLCPNHVVSPAQSLGIDLGTLEATAVVYIDCLPLGKELQRTQPCLAVAIAGAPSAAKGQLDLCSDGARIDIDDAGSKLAHGDVDGVHVASEDAAGEAVL